MRVTGGLSLSSSQSEPFLFFFSPAQMRKAVIKQIWWMAVPQQGITRLNSAECEQECLLLTDFPVSIAWDFWLDLPKLLYLCPLLCCLPLPALASAFGQLLLPHHCIYPSSKLLLSLFFFSHLYLCNTSHVPKGTVVLLLGSVQKCCVSAGQGWFRNNPGTQE